MEIKPLVTVTGKVRSMAVTGGGVVQLGELEVYVIGAVNHLELVGESAVAFVLIESRSVGAADGGSDGVGAAAGKAGVSNPGTALGISIC